MLQFWADAFRRDWIKAAGYEKAHLCRSGLSNRKGLLRTILADGECFTLESELAVYRCTSGRAEVGQGHRGVVGRFGSEYHVTVAAEMDTYPKYAPWVFVDPHIAGTNERGKLCSDVGCRSGSKLVDVIGPVVAQIEGAGSVSRTPSLAEKTVVRLLRCCRALR